MAMSMVLPATLDAVPTRTYSRSSVTTGVTPVAATVRELTTVGPVWVVSAASATMEVPVPPALPRTLRVADALEPPWAL